MHALYIFITIMFGFLVGIAFAVSVNRRSIETMGSLVIDKSDPDDGPYMFLELKTSPAVIETKDRVTLQVVHKNYISQK